MAASTMAGLALVVGAGVSAGLASAPIKLMKEFRYEHWALVSALVGMVLLPWGAAAILCPDLGGALAEVPAEVYVKANLWSLAWGVANVLCCLSLVRIGFSLTMGLLTGVGLPVGMLMPLIVKGSGEFSRAPALWSGQGACLSGIALVLMIAVGLMARAGFAREKSACPRGRQTGGAFRAGLAMSIAAGVLQAGLSLGFVYSQGPLTAALAAHGAEDAGATVAAWAVTIAGGAVVNLLYPLGLLLRRGGFGGLGRARDLGLCVVMGTLFFALLLCMGSGMRLLGALGASLGFGLYQGLQILTAQGVGIAAGEWRGAAGPARRTMALGVLLVLLGVTALAIARG